MPESVSEQFTRWKNRIDAGKKSIDDQKCDWDKFTDAYYGRLTKNKTDNSLEVNLFYVDVRSTTPKLYSQNPHICIDPETPEADLNAETMEKVVNGKKDDWKLKERAEELINGCKIKGRAYLKTFYKFDKDKIAQDTIGFDVNDEIVISFIPRENLIIDRLAASFESRRWAAHKVMAPIRDIRKKFKLKQDDKISVVEEKDLPDTMPDDEKEDFQFGCYYEIEDLEDRTLAIIVDGLDRWAVKPYKHPYGFRSMYDALEWNRIPGSLDTKGDLHFWWKQLIALADLKSRQAKHVKKLNAKYIVSGNHPLSKEQENQLKSSEDSSVANLPLGTTLLTHQHAKLGDEVYLYEQSLRQDIAVISGMNEMKQGLPQARKTAREAMAIVQESQDVMSYRAAMVEQVISSVMEKCVWLIQNFYDTTRVVGLTGMDEVELLGLKDKYGDRIQGDASKPFLSFVGKELTGKMRARVKAGSAAPVNEAQRRDDIMTLVQFMGQSQQLSAAVDSKELTKEIAKALHIENKGIIFDAKSPEQENVLLKRDVPVMPNMNENHDMHLAAHEMESNNTPAFLQHIFGHRLLKSFIEKSQMAASKMAPQMMIGPGGLSQQNISGLPMGSSVPPSALPQQGPAQMPVSQPQMPPAMGMQ